jgi:hypothetical protein
MSEQLIRKKEKICSVSLSDGYIDISWPEKLTVDDVIDIQEVFRILVRGMQRQVASKITDKHECPSS